VARRATANNYEEAMMRMRSNDGRRSRYDRQNRDSKGAERRREEVSWYFVILLSPRWLGTEEAEARWLKLNQSIALSFQAVFTFPHAFPVALATETMFKASLSSIDQEQFPNKYTNFFVLVVCH
jgi:hypothetical protein